MKVLGQSNSCQFSGAIAINLCGGIALALWLIFGGLPLPTRGYLFLGGLAFLLIAISGFELWAELRTG